MCPIEESLRKNRRRFNPDQPDSILEHGLPDAKLEPTLSRKWTGQQVSAPNPETLDIRGSSVPYAVFSNHDDVTTSLGPVFETRLESTLNTLWDRWARHAAGRRKPETDTRVIDRKIWLTILKG